MSKHSDSTANKQIAKKPLPGTGSIVEKFEQAMNLFENAQELEFVVTAGDIDAREKMTAMEFIWWAKKDVAGDGYRALIISNKNLAESLVNFIRVTSEHLLSFSEIIHTPAGTIFKCHRAIRGRLRFNEVIESWQ